MRKGDPRGRHEGEEGDDDFDLIDKLEVWRLSQLLTEAEATQIPDGATERIHAMLQTLLNKSGTDSGEQQSSRY